MLKSPVPDGHLNAIGRVTVNFAMLESSVAFLIWQLTGTEQPTAQAITAELSFRQLIALASSLYRRYDVVGDDAARFETILNRAVQAEERRNRITHSVWGAGKQRETVTRIKTTAKKSVGLKHQFEQMSVSDLEAEANFIASVADEVQRFMFDQLTPIRARRHNAHVDQGA